MIDVLRRRAMSTQRTRTARRRSAVLLSAAAVLTLTTMAPAFAAAVVTGSERHPDNPGANAASPAAQVVTDLTGALEPEDLAQSLVGEGVAISNVQYTGDEHGGGTFSGFQDVFGVDGGIALSSGSVAGDDDPAYTSNIIGPNVADGVTAAFGTAGDSDLDALVAPLSTADATVLEFDFVSDGSDISFRYVFASEEYLEYVGSEFNDVFAFFVDGENCATVPDPSGGASPVPVTINTINKDANPTLFRSNSLSDVPPAPFNTELDGFTTTLTCAAGVEAGETQHLKLAIADTSDLSLDSTVLIAAGTLQANQPPVADDQSVQTPPNTPVGITLTGSDPNGDPLSYAVVDAPTSGTLSGVAPTLTYTPDNGFTGADTFTFTVSDGAFVSDPATVAITVDNVTVPPTTDVPTPTVTVTLPTTGADDSTPWLAASAAALLTLGAALVLTARRRLRTTAS